jgi:hypothetical protein
MTDNDAQRVASTTTTQQLANALAGLKDGTFVHVREASRATGTSRSTIRRHLYGGLSKREAQHSRQQLSPDEERALAKWVQHLASTGHPVHHSFLRELAEEIRKPRVGDSSEIPTKLGKNWVSRFLARNPILQSKIAKNIEAARKEVTEAQLNNWFKEFEQVVDEYGIQPEHIYNMDETGTTRHQLLG